MSTQPKPDAITAAHTGRYFVHMRIGDNYPLLDAEDGHPLALYKALYSSLPPRADLGPLRLRFGEPVPQDPKLADYHSQPYPIISDKFKGVLQSVPGIKAGFYPSTIEVAGQRHRYWFLQATCILEVMDSEASEVSYIDITHNTNIGWVNKLVLDYDKLYDIPLADRLFFKHARTAVTYLWHESVVEAALAHKLTGLRFVPADNFNQSSMFD